jgi:hypothetical protein
MLEFRSELHVDSSTGKPDRDFLEPRHVGEILSRLTAMKRSLLALMTWFAAGLEVGAVDLTPRYIDTFRDGVTVHRLFFANGDEKIGLSINRETTVEGGSAGVVFRFPKFPSIVFVLKHSPMSADQDFEGVCLERYREAAHRQLPPGAQQVTEVADVTDPIRINRWHSHRFEYSCEVGGIIRHVSVTFLTISPNEQLLLVVSSAGEDAKEAAARSWQIIRSWQPLLPADVLPPSAS